MAEFIGIGDLHYTDQTGKGGLANLIEDLDLQISKEVDKVCAYARDHGITDILLYGDIGDGPRLSYDAMLSFTDMLERNHDLMFYGILGNHDMYGTTPQLGHSMQLVQRMRVPNLKIATVPRTVKIQGVEVRLCPYPHLPDKNQALNVFHNEVYGSKNDHGRVNKDETLTKTKRVAVAGHLHTAHRVRNTFYSGTLQQQNFGESLPKYFHHIEFNSPEDFDIRLVKHKPTYRLHNVVLNTRRDLKNIPQSKFDLVKLIIKEGCDVSAADYGQMPNIAAVKNFRSKEDLASVLTEDLTTGTELRINVDDFFEEWILAEDTDDDMREQVRAERQRILHEAEQAKKQKRRIRVL